MATINFLYRSIRNSAPLTLRLLFSYNNSNFVLSVKTKEIVNKDYWETKHFKRSKDVEIKKRQVELCNKLLNIEKYILTTFNECETNSVNRNWIKKQLDSYYNPPEKQKLNNSVSFWIDRIINEGHLRDNGKGGIGISKSRIDSYKRLKSLFESFQGDDSYTIQQLDKQVFHAFKKWLLDKNNYSHTYTLKKLADLKTTCKEARTNGVPTSDELTDIKIKQVSAYDDDMDVITLTLEEIEKIENAVLTKDSLINARSWLILACFTGQRGKSLTERITAKNFEKYGEDLIIKFIQRKGNKPVIIPVLPKVKKIYENGLPRTISPKN